MMYFILWVVFLLVVILAVPIASFLEKRNRSAASGPVSEAFEEELEEELEAVETEFAEVEEESLEAVAIEGEPLGEEIEELQ
jgi:hypothetical protein